MRQIATPLAVAATLAIVVALFHLKQRVGDLERELDQINRRTAAHQESIQVLRTEWSYLNQPAMIAELAQRHLGMRPNAPAQLIRLQDLPLRRAAPSGVSSASAKVPRAGTRKENAE